MSQEYRYILRIMGTDVQGTLKTSYAVAEVKGVSASLSNAVLKKAGVNPDIRVGFLTESDVSKIEDVIREPAKYGIPSWMFNRRKDVEWKRCSPFKR
jgi:small subunit ribosomal protein S13